MPLTAVIPSLNVKAVVNQSVAVRRASRPKVLAISSGGGHWVQLMRLRPAFSDCDVLFASVSDGYAADVGGSRFAVVPKSDRWSKIGLLRSFVAILSLVLKERPDAVVTTGAAPGFLALVAGKLIGSRTLWVDSLANVEELSLSGRRAGKFADLRLTQWPHLAQAGGPEYRGSVL